jgi:hypothetical protein
MSASLVFSAGDEGTVIDKIMFDTGTSAPIPEPTTILLLGSGLIGLVEFRRKFRKLIRRNLYNERIPIQFKDNKATGKTKR